MNTPKFGPLSGVRVVFSAIEVAGPYAAQTLAEWGAEVIWIEHSKYADTIRVQPNYPELSRRNLYALSLNIFSDEGKEVFYELIKTADIFIEASKGPAFANKGITDEVLWGYKKDLVIAHISGFGQFGDDYHTNLAAYNTIAQAFSGYLIQNGDINQPMPAFPYTADYMVGLTAAASSLAALHKAKATGVGESIDVCMYEVMLNVGQYYMMDYFNGGEMCPRMIKGKDPLYAGCGLYKCADGYIVFEVVGDYQVQEIFKDIGIGHLLGSVYPAGTQLISRKTSGAEEFETALDNYFIKLSVKDALDYLKSKKIAGAKVLEVSELESNSQYQARKSIITWQNEAGKTVKGPNVMPRFKNNPGQVWRPMPSYGKDTRMILSELGLSEARINELAAAKVINCNENR